MLPENIAALRRGRGWSQEELAEKLGVSRQSVSKWERGAAAPELDKLLAMSGLFGVTVEELTRDGTPPAGRTDERTGEPERGSFRLGLGLCIAGAAMLIAFSLAALLFPDKAGELNASSAVTVTGGGLLLIFAAAVALAGLIIILRRR